MYYKEGGTVMIYRLSTNVMGAGRVKSRGFVTIPTRSDGPESRRNGPFLFLFGPTAVEGKKKNEIIKKKSRNSLT